MTNKIEQEILINHKKETHFQSIGMIVGIALSMFLAMTVIDVVKDLKDIKAFIVERQNMPTKVLKIVAKSIEYHDNENTKRFNEIDMRLNILEQTIK